MKSVNAAENLSASGTARRQLPYETAVNEFCCKPAFQPALLEPQEAPTETTEIGSGQKGRPYAGEAPPKQRHTAHRIWTRLRDEHPDHPIPTAESPGPPRAPSRGRNRSRGRCPEPGYPVPCRSAR